MKNSESLDKLIPTNNLYRFGQFVLDPDKRALCRADSPVSLTPRAFDVLLFLAQNANRLVTKEELLEAVWGDTFVEEGNLTQYISLLRKALGDNSEDSRLIVTIARKGYQFTEDVTVAEAPETVRPAAVPTTPVGISSQDTQAVRESSGNRVIPRPPKRWPYIAALAAFTVILAAVGYASRRYFANPTPRKSQKIMLAVLPFENLT